MLRTALCQSVALPEGDAPDWLHLLPAGTVLTVDGRGPYRVGDAAALAAASLQAAGGRMPLDENHSTDLAAPKGGPSPARGWIVALEARQDGIWGQVEWTGEGRRMIADRAYRHISPVITHTADKRVTGLLRASLVNMPNLRGLAALHSQEVEMDLLQQLRDALGLAADADDAAAIAAVKDLRTSVSTHAVQLAPIAKAAGLDESATGAAVLQAVQSLRDPAKMVPAEQVTALQQQLTSLSDSVKREKAEAFVDRMIADGKVGVTALRDHYVARHMADAASVERELGVMPSMTQRSGTQATPPAKDKDGQVVLNSEQVSAARVLGIPLDEYRKTVAAEQAAREEAL